MPHPLFRFAFFVLVMMFSVLAGPVMSEDGSTRKWRMRYHETLPELELERSPASASRSEELEGVPQMRVSLNAFGRNFDLELESNARLVADLDPAGRDAMGPDMRLFRGGVAGEEDSWLRLAEQNGAWSGVIWDGVELYVIDPADDVAPAMMMPLRRAAGRQTNVIYRLSDTEDDTPLHCGSGSGEALPVGLAGGFGGLLAQLESVAPLVMASATTEEALELAVVADTQFVALNGANTEMAVISRFNVVDGIFESQVGVALSLVEIISLASNGSLASSDAGELLNQLADLSFSGEIDNPGLVHLFTGRNLNGSTAGIAFLQSICRRFSGVGLSEVRGGGTRGAITVAHEIGHNFGAPHDNQNGSPCASTPSGFIMNPSLNFGGNTFSQCSLDRIAPIVSQAQCLVPVPEPSVTSTWWLGAVALVFMRGFGRAFRKETERGKVRHSPS